MPSQFAVIGNPIAHSLSPCIHHYFAQQTGISLTYEKMLVELDAFTDQVNNFFVQGGRGLNVTLPFKQEAYALASVRTPRCQQAGAANTLWMSNNQLHADNTDGIGFMRDLSHYYSSRQSDLAGQRVLVLGAGGAARGIIGPLLAASIDSLTVLNRSLERAAALQANFPEIHCISKLTAEDSYELIINATSAGVNQTQWAWDLDLACLNSSAFCYDLSYSLSDLTPVLQWMKNYGCEGVDGLGMLVEQAAEAFLIWHGIFPETRSVVELLRRSAGKR